MRFSFKLIIFLQLALLFPGVNDIISNIQGSLANKQFQTAMDTFNNALIEFDSSAELFNLGGKVALRMDMLDMANEYFQKAIELNAKNQDYRDEWDSLDELKNGLKNAKKSFDIGSVDDAIIEYSILAEKFPQNGIVFYTLGLVYKNIEEFDLAVENYTNALNVNPFEEKYAKAISIISQIMTKEGDTEYRRKEYNSAIEYYLKAVKYSPEFSAALFKIARTYYRLGDLDNAQMYLEKNIAIDKDAKQSYKMLGDIARKNGNIDGAIRHYKTAISVDESYPRAFYSLGTAYLSIGQNENSRDALKTAILLEPTYAKAYGTLGALEQDMGNLSIAIENYQKATENDAKAYDIFFRLASVLNLESKYEDAKKAAKDCLNIKRNYAPAYFELGMAEKALGNRVAAKAAFEKAQKDKNWRKSAQYQLDLLDKGL